MSDAPLEAQRRRIDRMLCQLEAAASQRMYPACEVRARELELELHRDLTQERQRLKAIRPPNAEKDGARLQHDEDERTLGSLLASAVMAAQRHDLEEIAAASAAMREAFGLYVLHELAYLGSVS